MSDAKHTPGPWVIWGEKSRTKDLTIGVTSETGPKKHICEMCWPADEGQSAGGPTGMDDARLIAAAPDLLAALQMMDRAFISRHGCFPLDRTNDAQCLWNDAMSATRAAIAKAEGRT